MTIELTKDSYILGFWFCSDPETGNDWMCSVQRDPKTGSWKGQYRFRYKKDDKLWDSDDKKSWYSFTAPATESEEEVIRKISEYQKFMAIMYPDIDKMIVQGGLEKMMELAPNHDWMNIKRVELPTNNHKGTLN